jgi:predicted HicB family RNase H-like nuclease
MPKQPKPRPVGRPKLASGHKASITPIRLSVEDRAKVEAKAAKAEVSVSEWIRRTINAAL